MNWAARALLHCPASPNQRLLLLLLAFHHNHTTGQCSPSNATLADAAGLSERRVQMNMRKLEKLGLVKVVKRFIAGLQTSNQYDLLGVTKKTGRPGVTGVSPEKEELKDLDACSLDEPQPPGQVMDQDKNGDCDE